MPQASSRQVPPAVGAALVLIAAASISAMEMRELHLFRKLSVNAPGRMSTDARCEKSSYRGKDTYTVSVGYTYTVGGITRFGNAYWTGNPRVPREKCESIAQSLKAGTAITAVVDSNDHRFSVLDASRQVRMLFVTGPLSVFAAAYLLYLTVRGRNDKPSSRHKQRAA
jgi:Protein of unknown function (DUF3592)